MNKPDLLFTCTALAAALGPDWRSVRPDDMPWSTLVRSDGLSLWCRLDHGRLVVTADTVTGVDEFGRPYVYHFDRPSITVDPSRAPQRLAADIVRRLLPDAEAWWRTATAWAETSRLKWEDHQQRRAELLALPGAHDGHDAAWIYGSGWRCDARTGDSVRLEFSGIDFADAVAVIHALNAARAARRVAAAD